MMVTILIAATQGFAPGLTSKASTVPTLERAAARRVQMGVRRKAPTGVSQTNGRMADVLGQSAAGGGIFPGDNMDDSDGDSMVPNLDAYKRKKPQAAKLQTKESPPPEQHILRRRSTHLFTVNKSVPAGGPW